MFCSLVKTSMNGQQWKQPPPSFLLLFFCFLFLHTKEMIFHLIHISTRIKRDKNRILKRHYLLKNESDWLFYPQSPQINEFVICVLGRPIIFEKSLFCHLTGHIKKSQIISKKLMETKATQFFFFVTFNNVKLPLVDSPRRYEFDPALRGVLG